MQELAVKLKGRTSSAYPIFIQAGLLNCVSDWMPKDVQNIVVITDAQVAKLYLKALVIALKKQHYQVLSLVFPAGEKYKTNKKRQS